MSTPRKPAAAKPRARTARFAEPPRSAKPAARFAEPEAPPPSWRAEDEAEAISRRYGHLDLDRGVFDALRVERPRPGLSTGAKIAIGGGLLAVLGLAMYGHGAQS
jgi:hypothetical protein